MGTMFDTVDDPRQVFSGLNVQAVAAYGNGSFANFTKAKAEFPNLHVLEIDVNGQGIGNAGDFEAGDMAIAHAGSWAKGRIAAGVRRPVIYFSVSNWRGIMQSLGTAGIARAQVRIWTAHYTGKAHLCSAACGFGVTGNADATQWASPQQPGTLPQAFAHRNIDLSLTANNFFGAPTKPPPFPGRKLRQPPPMQGDDVRTWQAQMSSRGWLIVVNGTYDAASAHICKQFQQEKGLNVTGVVGPATWKAAWTAPIT
jgi:peptidoglycan hydrolase-like protein with peptidoglycan-binding domain